MHLDHRPGEIREAKDAWNSVVWWYYCHVFWAFIHVVFTCLVSVYLRDRQVRGVKHSDSMPYEGGTARSNKPQKHANLPAKNVDRFAKLVGFLDLPERLLLKSLALAEMSHFCSAAPPPTNRQKMTKVFWLKALCQLSLFQRSIHV